MVRFEIAKPKVCRSTHTQKRLTSWSRIRLQLRRQTLACQNR